jgi:CheY-like chemotaxis protein
MSHELRTPLNSLLILAKLLAENSETNLTAQQVEFAETIHNAGTDLLQLINDILDLSKVEAGKMDVGFEDVALPELTDYVRATFEPFTTEKGLAFDVETGPDVPPALHTDPHRLRQILRNLLSNAVKFTEAGHVRLQIHAPTGVRFHSATLAEAGQVLAFTVEDTGIGIPADKQLVIFEAFQQADGTTSRKYGGTGLGLSISREIAHLLGGEIHVSSEPETGSRFTLYLPVASAAPAGAVAEAPAAEPGRPVPEPVQSSDREFFGGRRVLVVDDDVRNVFALTSALERCGMEVLYAENGRQAISVLEDNPALELVLMDVMMPELDGYATMRALREMPRFETLPIIAVTAKAMKGDRERSIASGASDYVTKPVDLHELLALMRRWLVT